MVSVIMPFYNTPAGLTEQTLESVAAQGVEGLEVIIVDDGSAAEAATNLGELVARFNGRLDIRLIRQENAGPSAARNRAVAEARCDVIAQVDSDDRWLEGKLVRQLDVLLAEPDTWMVFGAMAVEDNEGHPIKDRRGVRRTEVFARGPAAQYLALLENNYVNNSTTVFRRRGFEELGGYDPSFRISEDTDLWLRACRRGLRIRYLDEPLAVQVFHGANLSTQREKRREAWLRLLDRELRDLPGCLAEVPRPEVREALARAWLKLGRYAAHFGKAREAREAYAASFRGRPSLGAAAGWLGAAGRSWRRGA